MPILQVLVVLIVIGLILWLVETYIPMSEPIKVLVRVVAVILVIVILLQLVGLVGPNTLRLR